MIGEGGGGGESPKKDRFIYLFEVPK